jgi:hypothetical protein
VPVSALALAARAAKKAAKAKGPEPEDPPPPPGTWRKVDTQPFWLAQATDGVGHHDGVREYDVVVKMADFGELFFPGGEARFTQVQGGDERVHRLPAVWQTDGGLRFRISVCPEGAMGRVIIVAGLETRPPM